MSSIALPALHINPPEQQPNALEQYARIMQLKQQQAMMPGQLQQQQQTLQAGAQENQMRQQQIADQKAMTDAMHEWDGKDMNSLPGLMLKHGASAQAVMTTKTGIIKQQQDFANLTKDQQAIQANKTNLLLGGLQAASQAPDDKLADSLSQTIQDHVQAGNLDPQHAQIGQQLVQGLQSGQITPELARKQLSLFEKSLMGTKEQQEQELKGAETAKNTAQASSDNANAEKTTLETNQLKQYGGLTQGAADAKYRFLQQRAKLGTQLSADDKAFIGAYEKQKTLVPVANFNLQNALPKGEGGQPSAMAQAVASGQMKWGDAISARTPIAVKEAFAKEVKAINPDFNSGDFDVEKKVREKYTSGNVSDQLLAINTAREHMKTFGSLADALDNGNVQLANKIGNALGVQFGTDKATNFKIAAQAFGGEVGKALDGAHVTAGEREQAASAFNANMSPEQFRGAVRTVDSLLAGKQKAANDAYKTGTQGKPNFGNQPEAPKGMIQARDPQGKLHQAPAGTPLPTGWKLEQ